MFNKLIDSLKLRDLFEIQSMADFDDSFTMDFFEQYSETFYLRVFGSVSKHHFGTFHLVLIGHSLFVVPVDRLSGDTFSERPSKI